MSKAEDFAIKKYPVSIKDIYGHKVDVNLWQRKACVEGYHQAEKDLDISWVKEVFGVKEMKRAKEEELKAYPPISIAANYDTISRRDAFEYGYLKAEKDLELTWEDIEKICLIAKESHKFYGFWSEIVYGEILKRFNKERKEK